MWSYAVTFAAKLLFSQIGNSYKFKPTLRNQNLVKFHYLKTHYRDLFKSFKPFNSISMFLLIVIVSIFCHAHFLLIVVKKNDEWNSLRNIRFNRLWIETIPGCYFLFLTLHNPFLFISQHCWKLSYFIANKLIVLKKHTNKINISFGKWVCLCMYTVDLELCFFFNVMRTRARVSFINCQILACVATVYFLVFWHMSFHSSRTLRGVFNVNSVETPKIRKNIHSWSFAFKLVKMSQKLCFVFAFLAISSCQCANILYMSIISSPSHHIW